jgi:hypothetical protein
MRSWVVVSVVVLGSAVACARGAKEGAVQEARPIASAEGAAPRPQAPRRVPPTPMKLDTLRREAVAELMATLAGRENEPAGTVFKNVKLHKTMPAKEFVTMMDEQFGRGLGVNCTGCHMDNKDYASDARKDKIIALQMIKMQRDIDAKYIAKVKELDDPRPKTTCVMCHRGAGHLTTEMDVPTAPVPQRKRG